MKHIKLFGQFKESSLIESTNSEMKFHSSIGLRIEKIQKLANTIYDVMNDIESDEKVFEKNPWLEKVWDNLEPVINRGEAAIDDQLSRYLLDNFDSMIKELESVEQKVISAQEKLKK